jgi:hypothetical protein
MGREIGILCPFSFTLVNIFRIGGFRVRIINRSAFITLSILIFFFTTTISTTSAKTFVWGNSVGNIANGGYIVESKGWVYFSVCGIISKKQLGKDTTYKLTTVKGDIRSINVINGWIYYLAIPHEGGLNEKDFGIYRVSIDGKRKNKIATGVFSQLYIVGSSLFYSTSPYSKNSSTIVKANLDGKNPKVIYKGTDHVSFSLDSTFIYFSSKDKGISRMTWGGTGKKVISNDTIFQDFIAVNSWVYYQNIKDGKLYKVRNDGKGRTLLTTESIFAFHVNEKGIFYNDKLKYLIRTDLSGKNRIITGTGSMAYAIHHIKNHYYFETDYSDKLLSTENMENPNDFHNTGIEVCPY